MISSYQTHNCDLPSPLARDLNKAGILHRSTSKENPFWTRPDTQLAVRPKRKLPRACDQMCICAECARFCVVKRVSPP